jgi:hypothetical protein
MSYEIHWNEVYHECISGLIMTVIFGAMSLVFKIVFRFSLKRYLVEIVNTALSQCAKNNRINYRRALKEMDQRISARKEKHGKVNM